jgi:topoisomerase-4 subunit A
MSTTTEGGEIRDTRLTHALSERYLAYALSTITARSLPDVRDGLKPVHRRVLWAMRQLRLDPEGGFKKCARVVGDVIGKYHPHGDAAVYEALVRLAQDFAQRYPLVEGQGNFGNIDGDNAAAMRYTEARLTPFAVALLEGLEADAVDFRPTYDGEDREPVVLPAAVPNLLANGASGIAVGMATSIPPHNLGELCRAALHLIRHPQAETRDLLAHLPGPDFPTGGVLVEPPEAIAAAYETGRGGFRLRARWQVERQKGGGYVVVVSEIPYQVPKSRLIEQIAEALEQKKLPLLADVRDESTDRVRIVLEPRTRSVDPAVLMESLFRTTALETRFPLNMNVLEPDRTPRVMGLKEVLRAWLDHRHEVLRRTSAHRLAQVEKRLEVLDGFLVVYLNLDEVIRILRQEEDPKQALMAAFSLSASQAEAILDMRLRSLRQLEEMEIRREHKRLAAERKELIALLQDESRRWRRIAEEIAAIAAKHGDARRTTIERAPAPVAVDDSAFIEREPITVILSEKGWIRAQKGHLPPEAEIRYKEGDGPGFLLHADTHDRLLLFASNGRAYTLKAEALPRGRGDGQPLRLLIDLPPEEEPIALLPYREGRRYLLAASNGKGFLATAETLLAEKRTGKQVLVVDPPVQAIACIPAEGDMVAVLGQNRKLLVFPLDQVPEMVRGRGVTLQSYRDGGLADITVFRAAEGLVWKQGERIRSETDLSPWRGNRGQAGKTPPHGLPKERPFRR